MVTTYTPDEGEYSNYPFYYEVFYSTTGGAFTLGSGIFQTDSSNYISTGIATLFVTDDDTNIIISGLSPNTGYYFYVQGFYYFGSGSPSAGDTNVSYNGNTVTPSNTLYYTLPTTPVIQNINNTTRIINSLILVKSELEQKIEIIRPNKF
jgi:hypothetical protein